MFIQKFKWFAQGFAFAAIALFIGCSFPAVAQDYCYAGVSAGVSYASDQYIDKLEGRAFEIVNHSELALRHTEKKWGQPYELFAGCRKGWAAVELGQLRNISASVKTNATFKIAGQTFSGDVNRVADVEGTSLSLLAYQRIGESTEVFERLGGVYASGVITAALPLPDEYDGGVIAYRRKAWLPRVGLGIKWRLGPNTNGQLELGAVGTFKVPFVLGGLSQRF
jgi:hypothetical protein